MATHFLRRHRLSARTLPFQGGKTGSTPVGATVHRTFTTHSKEEGRMPITQTKTLCSSCNDNRKSLYPFDGGICNICLIKKFRNGFTLKEAKKKACTCLHIELERLHSL